MILKVFCDGGSRGNPGPAAIGVVIFDENEKIIEEISQCIGKKTNNQAEYFALIAGLEALLKYNPSEAKFFLDSEFVVKQMNGLYKVKNEGIKPLFNKARELFLNFKNISFSYVPREKNQLADALVNKALDELGF